MQKENALKLLLVLHKALLMGQLVFGGIGAYLVYTKSVTPAAAELEKVLQVAAIIVAAGGVYGGMRIFKKKLLQARDMESGKEKFALYRSALIIQWALLEAPSLFCIACFFLTGNYAFLALAMVLIFLFVMTAPSKIKMLTQLQISESELDEL